MAKATYEVTINGVKFTRKSDRGYSHAIAVKAEPECVPADKRGMSIRAGGWSVTSWHLTETNAIKASAQVVPDVDGKPRFRIVPVGSDCRF